MCVLSRVQLCVAPWTLAHQALLSMELFKQEYWNWLSFPSSRVFLTQGSNLHLLHLLHWQADSYTTAPPAKAYLSGISINDLVTD